MRYNPIPPTQAIYESVGDDIMAHEQLLQEAYSKINPKLHTMFNKQGEIIGLEFSVSVPLPGITQAALMEIVVRYRSVGWTVHYTVINSNTALPREPMVTFTIPAKG